MSEKNFEPITIPVIGRRNKIKGYCTWSAE